jgi:hypothetical protein
LVKDENSDLAYSHNTLNRWNCFSHLLNIHAVGDVRQIEIHTPEPSPSEAEMAIAKLRKYKSPSTDQILAELIQAGGETLQPEIHKLINYV